MLFLWFENIIIIYYLYMTDFKNKGMQGGKKHKTRKNKKSKTKKRKITKSKKLKVGGTLTKSKSRRSFVEKTENRPIVFKPPAFPELKLRLDKAKEAEEVIKEEKRHIEDYKAHRTKKNKEYNDIIKRKKKEGEYTSPLRNTATTDTHKVTNQLPGTPENLFKKWKNEGNYEQARNAGLTIDYSPLKIYSPVIDVNSPLKETSPWNSIPRLE